MNAQQKQAYLKGYITKLASAAWSVKKLAPPAVMRALRKPKHISESAWASFMRRQLRRTPTQRHELSRAPGVIELRNAVTNR